MAEIDPVILQLRADVMKYRADMEQTARRVTANLDRQERSVISLEKQMLRSSTAMSGSLRSLGAAFASYLSIRELAALSDGFTRLQNNLRVAGLEGDALKQTQDRLFESAQKYGVEIEGLSSLYSSLSQASKELGASQNQIFGITDAVSASLKITGLSAQQAQGALLQLGQALRGGKVQAEEYNSLLDGLYPLLEAAANGSSRFGGSVAKLTAAVKDGKVSSQEFFQAILAGSDTLESKANKAALTLSGGLATLNNALTVYFGEADKANGVSAAMGEAFKLIADNLDLLVPAIAAVSIGFGVNYVGAMVAAQVATARTAIATVGLSAALKGLIANPIILALSALAAGVAYVALRSDDAATSTKNLTDQQKALQAVLSADKTDRLAGATNGLSNARSQLTKETIALAKAEAYLRAQQAENALNLAKRGVKQVSTTRYETEPGSRRRIPVTTVEEVALGNRRARGGDGMTERERALKEAERNFIEAGKAVNAVRAAAAEIGKGGVSGPAITSDTDKKKAKGKSGPSAEELAARYEQELSRLRVEQLQAELQLATDAQDRADLQKQILEEERNARVAEINANKDLTQPQRDAELEKIYKLYGKPTTDANGELGVTGPGLYQQGVNRDLQIQREREAADLADADARNKQDMLRADLQLADTREEKLALEMRLLDLAYEQEKLELEAVVASTDATKAQKQIAEERLRILGQLKSRDAASIQRDNEGPLAAYARNLGAISLGDQAEQIVVDQLQTVQNGITDALAGALGTKNSLIKSLIAMFVQQVIMRPIAEALAQSGGGGGLGGLFGSILGGLGGLFGRGGGGVSASKIASGNFVGPRASGGYVAPGQAVRVNEHRGTGVELLRMGSQGGTVIPLGQASAAPRGGNIVVYQHVSVDARNSVNPDGFERRILASSAQQAQQAGAAAYKQAMADAPAAIRKQSRYGTS